MNSLTVTKKQSLDKNSISLDELIARLSQKISLLNNPTLAEKKIENISKKSMFDFKSYEEYKDYQKELEENAKKSKKLLSEDQRVAKARILEYIRNPEPKDTSSEEHKKITILFEYLSALSRGAKNWVKDIDAELLENDPLIENQIQAEPKTPSEALTRLIDYSIFLLRPEELEIDFIEEIEPIQNLSASKQSHCFIDTKVGITPSDKVLFHIHANEFGSSSELEGMQPLEIIEYTSAYLKNCSHKISPELIEELDATHIIGSGTKATYDKEQKAALDAMDSRIDQMKQTIENTFQTKKELLIAGGWIGAPFGHSIYYEIIPQSGNLASFRLYNLGDGVEHHPSVHDGLEIKYQCYCEWTNISKDKLTSPLFLQALYEMQSFTHFNFTGTGYAGRDVYIGLKGLLGPSEKGNDEDYCSTPNSHFMTPQRCGICPFKGLMAVCRAKMPFEQYKMVLACDFKLQSLLDYVRREPISRNKKSLHQMRWNLVMKSHQTLCQSFLKLHKQHILGDCYLESVLPHLKLIAEWIEKHVPDSYIRRPQITNELYRDTISFGKTKNPHAMDLPLNEIRQKQGEVTIDQSCLFVCNSFQKLCIDHTPSSIENTLYEAVSLAQKAWANQEDIGLHKGLIELISSLSLDAKFWDEAIATDDKKSEKMIEQLGNIAHYFFKSCFAVPNAHLISADKLYAFNKILFLQQIICRLGHSKSPWKGLTLFTHRFFVHENFFKVFSDSKMQRELTQMIQGMDTAKVDFNDQIEFYKFPGPMEKEIGLEIEYRPPSRYSDEKNKFEDIVRKEYPETILKIECEKNNYRQSEKHIQDAYIYSSEFLPEWIKSIRNTLLALHHLEISAVSNLASINRTSHLEQQFEIEGTENCKVKISITGVDNSIKDVPEIKKINERYSLKGSLRFIGPNRLQNFANLLQLGLVIHTFCKEEEKTLLASSAKDREIEMPDSDYKEVARLGLSANLTLIETLEFFIKHPEKLKDPAYRLILNSYLFSMGALENSLKINGFDTRLALFIQKKYVHFEENNDIQTSVFLLRLAHQLKGFCPNQPFFANTSDELKKLLCRTGLATQEKSLIHAELNSQLGSKEQLDEDDLTLLLAGSIYVLENNPTELSNSEPFIFKEAFEAIIVQASLIQRLLTSQSGNEILNSVLKSLRPKTEDKQWKIQQLENQFPSFHTTDGEYSYYPLAANLLSANGQTLLPAAILQNPLYRQYFPLIERGSILPGDIYRIMDENSRETLISANKGQMVIEQNWGTQGWHRLIPGRLMSPRHFAENCIFWQSLEDPTTVHALEKETNRKYLFRMDADKSDPDFNIQGIIDCKNLLKLSHTYSAQFSIEDSAYTHSWYDENEFLKKIELPRFGLSFKKDQGKLYCKEFPGYSLNQEKIIPELAPYQRFILLEKKGKYKVILPTQEIKAPSYDKREVLIPKYEPEQNLESGATVPQSYVVFDLQQDGSLISKSREAYLYLIYILTIEQNYEKAAYYLKRKYTEKLTAHGPSEIAILENICKISEVTGDKSGNGIALQLAAQHLLLKNSLLNRKQVSPEKIDVLRRDYRNYLTHYPHATAIKLQPAEEILVLTTLLSDEFDISFYLRLSELDPQIAKQISLPSPKEAQKSPDSLSDFQIPIDRYQTDEKPHGHVLLTRAAKPLHDHFLYYYKMAKEGSEKKKLWLAHALHFALASKDAEHVQTAEFFQALLKQPEKFPAPYISDRWSKNKNAEEKWCEEALAAAIAVRKEHFHPYGKSSLKPCGDITPKNFSLDEKKAGTGSISTPFDVAKIPSFASESSQYFVEKEELSNHAQNANELKDKISTWEDKDPVKTREIKRITNDITAYLDEKPPIRYILSEGEDCISAIEEKISTLCSSSNDSLNSLHKKIIELANLPPKSNLQIHQLKQWGNLQKVITLDELILNFGRQRPGELLNRNPALSHQDVQKLYTLVCEYLLHATCLRQGQKAAKTLKKLKVAIETAKLDIKKTAKKDALINQLGEDLQAKRWFEPQENPAYLVFEHRAEMMMRKGNVAKLREFFESGDLNLVMEMIMGSGKSAVLLPLLCLLRADGDQLSMLIASGQFFGSLVQNTQGILLDMGQSLEALHFDRNTKFTIESLEVILNHLEDIRVSGKCLIKTSKSLQCLILKALEEFNHYFSQKNLPDELSPELKLMQKIFNLLMTKGYPLIEEADTTLRVMHETRFSLGKPKSPESHELKELALIYSHVYEGNLFKDHASLESDPSPNESENKEEIASLPPFDENIHSKKIKEPLADAIIDSLKTADLYNSKSSNQKVKSFIQSLDDGKRKLLKQYLCRDSEHLLEAQKFYDELDQEVQNIIALAGEEISHLLPFTLMQVCNQKYGLDQTSASTEDSENLFAIPFTAAQAPSIGSSFAVVHAVMNYTFQAYIKGGIPLCAVKNQVKIFQEQAMIELACLGKKAGLQDTEAWKAFAALKGDLRVPLLNCKQCHLEEIVSRLNNDAGLKIKFVSSFILTQMKVFSESIKCNPHHIVALFPKGMGSTGSLSGNALSLHHTLTPRPAVGTDAKTLCILWANSRDGIVTIKGGSTIEMLAELKEKKIDFDMISDGGGYFKDGENVEIAHQIATACKKEVVFYNAEGEQTITQGEKEIPLPLSTLSEEERITFLDEINTTGANVTQKLDAVAIVTIGRKFRLRDLVQAPWRLRGLDKDQRARFLVTEDVAMIIRQTLKLESNHPIRFEEILNFAITNQASEQARDYYKALQMELELIPQFILLKVLFNEKLTPGAQAAAFSLLRKNWFESTDLTAHQRYGTLDREAPTLGVINALKQKHLDELDDIFEQIPWIEKIDISKTKLVDQINDNVKRMEGCLPAMLPSRKKRFDDHQTMEIERDMHKDTQTDMDLDLTDKMGAAEEKEPIVHVKYYESKIQYYGTLGEVLEQWKKEKFNDSRETVSLYDRNSQKFFPLISYLKGDKCLSAYADAFKGVYITTNALDWKYQENDPFNLNNFALLGPDQMPLHHLLIEKEKVLFLTVAEAHEHCMKPNYYNLSLGFIGSQEKPPLDVLYKIVKLKFLTGETHFDSDEVPLLRKWLAAHGVEKMQSLYLDHIININDVQKKKKYESSTIKRIFSEWK